MKAILIIATMAASVAADGAKAAGDPCTGLDDDCGDADSMCCGIATGGAVQDGGGKDSGHKAPNLLACNTLPSPTTFSKVWRLDKTTELLGKYDGTGFSCLGATRLISAAFALFAASYTI